MVVPGVALHVRHRGHNRSACFFGDGDYALYLRLLARFSRQYGCGVHAYCLMPNHVHVLLTPQAEESCALMMKFLAQCYAQHVNRTHGRCGSLWEGRFRSCPVDSERYALACYRYVELNPVSAGMVGHPGEYRWSSYRANAEGVPDRLIEPHPVFPGAAAYQGLFEEDLDQFVIHDLRKATNNGFVAGSLRRRRGRQMRKMGSVPI
ncbi:MAG TPA: transposase [Burkholderiales bacterium]|nr:transposase [Burkholderiales bacterium]